MEIQRGHPDSILLTLGANNTAAPVDSTTYFFGSFVHVAGADYNRIYFPRAGTITGAMIGQHVIGTLGTTETSSMWVRLNNTTDYLILSTFSQEAINAYYSNLAMSVPIAVSDYIEIKWTTPAWATNPTQVWHDGSLFLE